MITIDQLLESVDLDFEPRWVTKNKNGGIYVWEVRPVYKSGIWMSESESVDSYIAHLKMAEFEGKCSGECIYEVPKKVDYTKLVGKLCWFWDEGFNTKNIVGFLTNVDLESWRPFCIDNGDRWEHCEPVRPDDDVIYKEAVNELKGK